MKNEPEVNAMPPIRNRDCTPRPSQIKSERLATAIRQAIGYLEMADVQTDVVPIDPAAMRGLLGKAIKILITAEGQE